MNNKRVFEFVTISSLLIRALFRAAFLRTRLLKWCFSALFVLQLTEAHNLQLWGHTFGVLRQLRVDAGVFLRKLFSGRPRYGFLWIDCWAIKFCRGPISSTGFALSETCLAALLLCVCVYMSALWRFRIASLLRDRKVCAVIHHSSHQLIFRYQVGYL